MKAKNIYEFDIEGFFPNVDISEVTDILEKSGIPKRIVYHIENINRMEPILPQEEKLDETETKNRYKIKSNIKQGIYDPMANIYDELKAAQIIDN